MTQWLLTQLVVLLPVAGLSAHWMWRVDRDHKRRMAELAASAAEWEARFDAESERWWAGYEARREADRLEAERWRAEVERELTAAGE